MSSIRTTVWPLDPHTAAKHAILRRYLDAWIPIMSRHNGRVLYIDGFAGPGVYENGEPGSPVIALDAALGQARHISGEMYFIFIEENQARCDNLRVQIAQRELPAKLRVEVVHGRFGTNNLTGLAKMKESMWRVDQGGAFEFSDATNPDQTLLFSAAPDFARLRRELQAGLGGQTVTVEQVEEFVLNRTAFTASHYKRVLKDLETSTPPGLVVRSAKAGRKRGTFPPGTRMEFGA